MPEQIIRVDPIAPGGRSGWLKDKSASGSKLTNSQVSRLSSLRMMLAGASPGLWASNHLEELQHMTGWNYVAIHAFALQFAGAKLTCYLDQRYAKQKGLRERMPSDPIEKLAYRLRRLRGELTTKSITTGEQTSSSKKVPLPDEHRLSRLMSRPNPAQSGAQFRYQVAQQIGLTGKAIVWSVRGHFRKYDKRGRIREQYVIPTGIALPQAPSGQFPEGWYQVRPGTSWTIAFDEDGYTPGSPTSLLAFGGEVDRRDCREICWPHPYFLNDSLSPLSAGAVQIDIAEEIDRAIWSRFKNEHNPGMQLEWDNVETFIKVAKEELDAFREQLRARSAGTANTGRDFILPPGLKGKPYNPNPKEMDFANTRPQARDGVLALHGTPGTVAGINEAASYGSLYASIRQYTEQKIQPNLSLFAEEQSAEVCPGYGPGHSIEAKARSIEDPTLEAQRKDRLNVHKLLTVDEARAQDNVEPHPDQEFGKLPVGTTWTEYQQIKQQQAQAAAGQQPGGQPGQNGQQPPDAMAGLASILGGGADASETADATSTNTKQPMLDAPPGRSDVMKAAELDKPHKFATTQLQMPDAIAQRVLQFGRTIPDTDLADDGRCEDIHATVLYGLHTGDAREVFEVIRNFGPVRLKIGAASLFCNDDADVLKLDIDSDDIRRLNQALRDALPHTQTKPDYIPHVTIAYVKPGKGPQYAEAANRFFADDPPEMEITQLVFSDPLKNRHVIPLTPAGNNVVMKAADVDTKSFNTLIDCALDFLREKAAA